MRSRKETKRMSESGVLIYTRVECEREIERNSSEKRNGMRLVCGRRKGG